MALDSLAGEPAPSQRRVAIHERAAMASSSSTTVSSSMSMIVTPRGAWTTFAGGPRAPGPRNGP
jgi:hypothetical protein